MSNKKKGMKQLFHAKTKEETEDAYQSEIISMVNEGHEQGILLASEAVMIQNILEFGKKDAKDIMVHRKQMVCLDGDMTFGEAIQFIIDSTFSRFPVYLGSLDHIIGILHIKDALAYALKQELYDYKLRDLDSLLQKVAFIPETHGLNTLFTKMQSKKAHLMIVVDEYGQTSGLISLENILEEIVGNIQDEHDDEEVLNISKVSQNHYIMDGATPLDEAGEVLGIAFPDEFETLNGFLISLQGKIPDEHETFEVIYENYRFQIQDVEGRLIQKVRVSAM